MRTRRTSYIYDSKHIPSQSYLFGLPGGADKVDSQRADACPLHVIPEIHGTRSRRVHPGRLDCCFVALITRRLRRLQLAIYQFLIKMGELERTLGGSISSHDKKVKG